MFLWNSYSFSLARKSCHSFPFMLSELFLHSLSKDAGYHCYSAACPIPHGDVQADLLGSPEEMGAPQKCSFLPIFEVGHRVYCVRPESHLKASNHVTRSNHITWDSKEFGMLELPTGSCTKLRCVFVPGSYWELGQYVICIFHNHDMPFTADTCGTLAGRDPKRMLGITVFKCN